MNGTLKRAAPGIVRLGSLTLLLAIALLAMPARASAGPPTSGVISVQFHDNVTTDLIPGQCVFVSDTQLCDGTAGDEDSDAGEIAATLPFDSYEVAIDFNHAPADRLVKAPTTVACALTVQAPLCSVVFSFNPTLSGPPAFPALRNLFLTSQDGNVEPPTCAEATDVFTFTHALAAAPPATVGGVELELRFDPALVCVDLEPGAYFQETPGVTCLIDDVESAFQFPGQARLACLVAGTPDPPSNSLELAVIHVRAQPSQYQSVVAGQDNGALARVIRTGCQVADLDLNPIPVFVCSDYELTIRRLEGDINGDCAVDVRDTQMMAFQLGRPPIGPFGDRLDIEPPGGDGKIDIYDLQFVAGRNGSTCAVPHPDQPPRKWEPQP
jgi:hypothetical protein